PGARRGAVGDRRGHGRRAADGAARAGQAGARRGPARMSRRARTAMAVLVLAGIAALTVWAVSGLLPFGTPSGPANEVTRTLVHQRQVANTVNGVTYDLRGVDTLGEELILFVAALGSAVLLRHRREDVEEEERAAGPP